jgi:hypothetical protein
MPDEKVAAVATYTARGREDAPAAPRHASLIVFVDMRPAPANAPACRLASAEGWC